MAKLYYQGHGSYRITGGDETVIYVDPFAGDGYELPADLILVTHQHGDHNQIQLPAKKASTCIITEKEALAQGKHQQFKIGDVTVEAVQASNKNHNPKECVGYIITIDGVKIYASGDTSKTEDMAHFAEKELDYALLPCDGIYNMDLEEAKECAQLIGAKHNIPIHLKPGELFDRAMAEKFAGPNKIIIAPSEEIKL